MKRNLPYNLLLVFLILFTGCKQKGKETISSVTEEAVYQPASPKYTAKYDKTNLTEKIDVESAISTSSPVLLSEVASTIEYYQVGDDKYPITDVVAVEGGFIVLNQPKLYLYRQGKKRKRVGLKTEYNDWKDYISGKNLFYDKATTKLYGQTKKINPETGYANWYIGELPPLDSVLARRYYLYPDSLLTRHLLTDYAECFTPEMYYRRFNYPGSSFTQGVTAFNLKNDTLCQFHFGIDSLGVVPIRSYYSFTCYNNFYLYENKPTFVVNFCDTVYRLQDHQTIFPAYYVHLGRYRLPASKAIRSSGLENKAWINGFIENPKGVFLTIHKEGTHRQSGWLEKEKNSKEFPSEDYQMVFLKKSRQTKVLPLKSKGLTNDLDEGLPFWPDSQVDEYMYMIRPASELKKDIKLTGSPKQKALKNFLRNLPDNHNVMIVVK